MQASDDWSAYARLQTELDQRRDVDDIAWGLEAGLNRLLTNQVDIDVDRTVRSAARQARHRARLLRIESFGLRAVTQSTFVSILDRTHALAEVRSRLSESDWQLLRLRASGYSYAAMAAQLGTTAGALRVRFARLKREMRRPAAELPLSA